MAQTLQLASDLGLDLICLQSLVDVDRPEDLPAWYEVQKISTQPDLSIIVPALNEAATIEST